MCGETATPRDLHALLERVAALVGSFAGVPCATRDLQALGSALASSPILRAELGYATASEFLQIWQIVMDAARHPHRPMSARSSARLAAFARKVLAIHEGPRAQLWEAYLNTQIVAADGRVLSGTDAVISLGRLEGCWLITAFNPFEVGLTLAENTRRQAQLKQGLREAGVVLCDAVGQSPDGLWREPSLAVMGLGEADIVRVGKAAEQRAVFHLTQREHQVMMLMSLEKRSRPRVQ